MLIFFNPKLREHIAVWIGIIVAIGNFFLYGTVMVQQDNRGGHLVTNHIATDNPGELCNRECVRGDKRVCYFDFTIEHYQAMGVACGACARGVEEHCNNPQCIAADGVEKGVMSINRQIPGPAIHVCKDDEIVVDVRNHAHGTAASLHWHGVHMTETPYMDGVPFLTQCPIPFSTTFRYQFRATEPGTQFYHSHSGHHKVNGQFGALIIREPKGVNIHVKYDFDLPEHHIIINDWMHVYAEQVLPGLPNSSILPNSVLINGRGLFTNPRTRQQISSPPVVYYVRPGYKYRFRTINSGNHVCPFQIQINRHVLTVIASDSFNVLPYPVETLVTNSGERYDFIVTTNHTGGDFLIRVRGMGFCAENLIESFAVLRYTRNGRRNKVATPRFPKYENIYPPKRYLNHPNTTCGRERMRRCVTNLMGVERDLALENAKPEHKFFLSFGNFEVPNNEIFQRGQYNHFTNLGSNTTVVASISGLSLIFPDYPPLTQPELIDETEFCDENTRPARCDDMAICHCIHRLKVRLNSVVELIIVDETAPPEGSIISHPFHLHGYRFIVTGMGRDPSGRPMNVQRAKIMDAVNQLPRFSSRGRPPLKDTVSIPSRGFAAVRFRATNPGFWLMHCHYDWHLSNGMGLILQVGETSQMVKPPRNFPKCGNYLPTVRVWEKS